MVILVGVEVSLSNMRENVSEKTLVHISAHRVWGVVQYVV